MNDKEVKSTSKLDKKQEKKLLPKKGYKGFQKIDNVIDAFLKMNTQIVEGIDLAKEGKKEDLQRIKKIEESVKHADEKIKLAETIHANITKIIS